MIPRFVFGVYGFGERRWQVEPIASFFTLSDANSFAMHPEQGFEIRNLFVDGGKYDKRVEGYPLEQLTEVHGDPLLKRDAA